jgi:hypothetical protein
MTICIKGKKCFETIENVGKIEKINEDNFIRVDIEENDPKNAYIILKKYGEITVLRVNRDELKNILKGL